MVDPDRRRPPPTAAPRRGTAPNGRPFTVGGAAASPPIQPGAGRPQVPLPVPLIQALSAHPVLGHLAQRIGASSRCLRAVEDLIPPALRPGIQAGPIESGTWTLLAANAAVAAKLRQLLPWIEARLREQRGAEVTSVRVRLQRTGGPG